jgi:hypothetical protein
MYYVEISRIVYVLKVVEACVVSSGRRKTHHQRHRTATSVPNPSALLIGRLVHGYPVAAGDCSTTVLTGRSGALYTPGIDPTAGFGAVTAAERVCERQQDRKARRLDR